MSRSKRVSELFRSLGDRAVEMDTRSFGPVDVHRIRGQLGLTREEADEALAELVEKGLVELQSDGIGSFTTGRLTEAGLEGYLKARSSHSAGHTGSVAS